MYRRVSHMLFPAPILWIVMFVLMIAMSIWAWVVDFEIKLGGDYTIFYVLAAGLAIGFIYHKRSPFMATFGFALSLSLLMSLVLRPLSYLGVATKFPIIDEKLAWFDHLVGFDWLAHVAWVNANPMVSKVLDLSYQSLTGQFIFIFLVFFLSQNYERLREFIMMFFFMGFVTTFIAIFTPAIGAFDYYNPDAAIISNLPPTAGRYFQEHFLALYDGSMRSVTISKSTGLIAFPSFHTQAAVLYMWATRRTIMFWPFLILNLCMVLSTLTFGGHFLGDLIAGVMVTFGVAYGYGLWAGRYGLSFPHVRVALIADQTGLTQAPIVAKIKAFLQRHRKSAAA